MNRFPERNVFMISVVKIPVPLGLSLAPEQSRNQSRMYGKEAGRYRQMDFFMLKHLYAWNF